MTPGRRTAAEALETRSTILERARSVARKEGFEGVTIGRLAKDIGMSKSGVIRHFGTKESLQLAAFQTAADEFKAAVWDPVKHVEPGLPRLRAICDSWIDYLDRDPARGGCLLAASSVEFDAKEGPVRDAVADALALWHGVIRQEISTAVEAGDLPTETDPDQLTFELNSFAMGVNQAIQLHRDPNAAARARRAMKQRLSSR